MNRLSKIITTTYEILVMIYSESNISAVSFSEHSKEILIEASRIAGKIGHSKMKKYNIIKMIREITIIFIKQTTKIIHNGK